MNMKTLEEIKKMLKSVKGTRIVESGEDKFNRALLDYGNFDILVVSAKEKKKDSIRNLDLDVNPVLARIASKKNIIIGMDVDEVRHLDSIAKAQYLSRFREIIKICRKNDSRIKLLNYSDRYSAESLLFALGASSSQVREALSF